jgi:hypothetical protein
MTLNFSVVSTENKFPVRTTLKLVGTGTGAKRFTTLSWMTCESRFVDMDHVLNTT